MSPALAGGFLTTAPPGKSLKFVSYSVGSGIKLESSVEELRSG